MNRTVVNPFSRAGFVAGALLLGALATAAVAAPRQHHGVKSTHKAGSTIYTCTMHPSVLSTRPGKCPKCGMALVKKHVAAVYTCPMHSSVLSLKRGNCPICGMGLVKKS